MAGASPPRDPPAHSSTPRRAGRSPASLHDSDCVIVEPPEPAEFVEFAELAERGESGDDEPLARLLQPKRRRLWHERRRRRSQPPHDLPSCSHRDSTQEQDAAYRDDIKFFTFMTDFLPGCKPNQRFIETVDLSRETFKPTPNVPEVIVINDTDVSLDSKKSDSPAVEIIENDASFNSPNKSDRRSVPLDCGICLDSFSTKRPTMSTFCGHIFCKPCLTKIMASSKLCPTCRTKLKGKGYHAIFL